MRLDRNDDKFAALFKAGKPRKARRSSSKRVENDQPDHSYDETIPAGTRLYKDQRERQIDAIKEEDRRAKRAREAQQRRIARISSQFPPARRFLKTLEKIAPTVNATGYLDCDVDLAGLARSVGLAAIPDDYDRFACFECAVALVRKSAKGTAYTEPDPETYFQSGCVTALDELKLELRI